MYKCLVYFFIFMKQCVCAHFFKFDIYIYIYICTFLCEIINVLHVLRCEDGALHLTKTSKNNIYCI